jgi:hypothetical protein
MRARRPDRLQHAVVASAVLVALGAGAAPALGQTHTLSLSAPSSAAVGQPIIIQASGFNPQNPIFTFTSWLDVSAIPTSVLTSCPAGYLNASQVASTTHAQGGEVVANGQREEVDAAGNFSMPVAHTARVPGQFLICGYTNDGATGTLATASLLLNVTGASAPVAIPAPGASPVPGPSAAAEPASVVRPRVRRSGSRLVCSPGSWSNSPSRYSYGWLVDGRRRRGARGSTLAISRRLRGRKVQCRVTAHNAAGATTALSRPLRIR